MYAETARLVVRPFAPGDAPALHELLSDPAVMRFLEPPFTQEQTERFLDAALHRAPPLVFAAEEKENGALAGYVIFHPFDERGYELGWVLFPALWGAGLASELTEAMLAEARRLGAAEAVIECDGAQKATRRIAEKFGFSLSPEDAADGLLTYRKGL